MKKQQIKSLIREYILESLYRWNTPEGAPSEVINVAHQVVASVHLSKKDPKTYMNVWKQEGNTGNWYIIGPNFGKNIALIYNESLNRWYVRNEKNKSTPVDDMSELGDIIKNWVNYSDKNV